MGIGKVIIQLLLYCWAFTLFLIFHYKQPIINILGEVGLNSTFFFFFWSDLGQKCYLSRMVAMEGPDTKENGNREPWAAAHTHLCHI